jgi:hypothetical protein
MDPVNAPEEMNQPDPHSAETAAMAAALCLHFEQHPATKPTLVETALALAHQDSSPLSSRPDLIAYAATALAGREPEADPDDVLLWAEAQLLNET